MERTLLLIKPDAVQRQIVGRVVDRLERKGLQLIGLKMLAMDQPMLRAHYAHLADKPFFGEIANFMQMAPLIASCWTGLDVVATVRTLCGITKAREAAPGTIRGDFAMSIQANVVHASDSPAAAEEEIARFFSREELLPHDSHNRRFLYSLTEQKALDN